MSARNMSGKLPIDVYLDENHLPPMLVLEDD